MRLRPARCRRHLVETVLFIQVSVGKPESPCSQISDLVSPPQVIPHSLFLMPPHMAKDLAAISQVEVVSRFYIENEFPHRVIIRLE